RPLANRPVVIAGSREIFAVSAAVAAPVAAGAVGRAAGCCAASVVAARQATAAAVVNFCDVFISAPGKAVDGLEDSRSVGLRELSRPAGRASTGDELWAGAARRIGDRPQPTQITSHRRTQMTSHR